jgi:hypothetical protein
MDMLLQRIQTFIKGLGANKKFGIWDRISNRIQDVRGKYTMII